MVQCTRFEVGVLSSTHGSGRSGENGLHLPARVLPVHPHAARDMWGSCHLSEANGKDPGGPEPARILGVPGRHYSVRKDARGA
ncbi:hypothetical protein FKM82_021155 [Ascaphus truei]